MLKRLLIAALLATVAALMLTSVVAADEADDSWSIGTHDDTDPFTDSAEYPVVGNAHDPRPPDPVWNGQFDYNVTTDPDDEINAPNFPGYIGPQNVCDVAVVLANPNDTRPCVDTAQSVVIHFTLTCDYPAGITEPNLLFEISRYGSENDNLFLDGEFFAEVNPGGEFAHQDFPFDLGALSAGEHTLEIRYQTSAGGQNNGHYIDNISLSAQNGNCGSNQCPAGKSLVTLDFETDGYGNPLSAGDIISGNEWAPQGVSMDWDAPGPDSSHPMMIFDSSNPTGNDPDLGSPNETFGGPGVGTGGESGQPGENSLTHGNILIISQDNNTSSPNDYASGGTIYFDFASPVTVLTVDALDIDGDENGYVATNSGGQTTLANLGDNSYQQLVLNQDGVTDLDVHFSSSGGLSTVALCTDEQPLPPQHWGIEIWKMFKSQGPVWEFLVRNIGASDLVNISLSYPGGPAITCDATSLASGEDMMCEATGVPQGALQVSFESAS